MLGILAYLAALAYAALTVNAILQKYPLTLLYTYHPLAASAFIVFAVCGIVTAQSAQKGNHKARARTLARKRPHHVRLHGSAVCTQQRGGVRQYGQGERGDVGAGQVWRAGARARHPNRARDLLSCAWLARRLASPDTATGRCGARAAAMQRTKHTGLAREHRDLARRPCARAS